jgi:serine/threonine protein kinase
MEPEVPQTRASRAAQEYGRELPPSPSFATIPERFGPYRRVRSLGEGGMGEVFLARDIERDRLVALKFSRFGPHARHAEGAERFRREALAASAFDHPGLCRVHDAGEVDGHCYIVMDYVEGEPLSKVLKRRVAFMDQPATAMLARRIALALAEAHARGVVHRDLKPSNIILRAGGDPVVINFGLAWWFVEGETRLTKTGAVLGTPHYMSPEQVNGDVRAMGPRCDV